ncbi:MAG TPA: hypothetical protein PK537_11050 [Candidatus Limiplasma sp.]|nr:hypothetical protein [Candidatus Limiplasma sp.]
MIDPVTQEVCEDERQFSEEAVAGQSGTLMDWSATGRYLREVPTIITWDDVSLE